MSHLPSTAIFYSEISSPIVTDLSGKGTSEIVTAWKIDPDPSGTGQDYNPFINNIYAFGEWGTIGENWSGGVVTFDANTGKQISFTIFIISSKPASPSDTRMKTKRWIFTR